MSFLRPLRRAVFVLACTLFAAAQTPAPTPPAAKVSTAMTNDDVIALSGAGLGDEIVIAKINAAPSTAFDTSLVGLKALKAAGVPIEVVKAMISPAGTRSEAIKESLPDPDDFNQIQPTGIYALVHQNGGSGHLTKLAYSSASRITQVFAVPIPHVRATLDGPKAALEFADASPSFYIYPKNDDATTQKELNTFQLVKFNVTKKSRELTLGSMNDSIDAKALTEIKIIQVKLGIYKVTLAKPLQPGEYALYQGGTWRPQIGPIDGGSYFEFGIQ